MLRNSFLILVSLFLVGCGFSPKEKIVYRQVNNFIPVVCPAPIKPLPVRTKPLNPTAVQDKANVWWVGFTPDEYGHLAINTEESIRFIKDQSGVVRYYQSCIDDFNAIVEQKNGNTTGEASSPTTEEIQTETSEEVE